jgi:UTP-glucose-1-phosphate uridylyltransferase/mevalonate kinase
MKLFVPGRICVLGEHSDWAGGYRRINSDVYKGCAIIVGTNQGLHADVEAHPNRFILEVPWRGADDNILDLPMNRDALLAAAEEGGFFSYACGVAYQILTHYNVGGLRIQNHTTDLPVKKGLSSSAATCVLVARAFNRVYDLKMTVRGEMEYAYQGEITTPSRCGRMDQGCAYGGRPVLMTFDGDRIDVTELKVGTDLYFVIVDLKAGKDTKEILAALNRCYPFPEVDEQRAVHSTLGPENSRIVRQAVEAIESGDATQLGDLMREAQANFDSTLAPLCPSQLTAPVLHELLINDDLASLVFGGKGVGSGGDGAAQLLCRDADSQARVIDVVERRLGLHCLPLTVQSATRVRKAVIPAAGYGTRLFPASKVVKKELFPVVDQTGRAKPAILAIVEELLQSGIEQIAIVIQERDREAFEGLFGVLSVPDNYRKLSQRDQAYCDELLEMRRRLSFITQESQQGFGHAVLCAREWVGREPFLLSLGDYIYRSDNETTCTRQILEVYERHGGSVVSVKPVPEALLGRLGFVGGRWMVEGSLLEISEFIEKPDAETAREHLRVEGLASGEYLGLFGQYVLSSTIFDLIADGAAAHRMGGEELQLTPYLDRLRIQEGFLAFLVRGRSYDIGVPDSYRETVWEFGLPGSGKRGAVST